MTKVIITTMDKTHVLAIQVVGPLQKVTHMSFIPAPHRDTNGITVVNRSTRAIDAGGFDTLAAVKSFLSVDSNYVYNGDVSLVGKRERQDMQRGIDTEGLKHPTSYYSFSAATSYVRPECTVICQEDPSGGNPGKFFTRSRSMGLGYIGGNSTGIGAPWEVFVRRSSMDNADRIGNMLIIDNVINRSEVECINKAKHQKFNYAEFIVDLDRSVKSVVSSVYTLVTAWKAVRDRDVRRALRVLRMDPRAIRRIAKNSPVSDNWLALQYGWLPLANDIYDAVNAFNTGIGKPDGTFAVSRRVTESLPFWDWQLNPSDDPWKNPVIQHEVLTSSTVKLRYRVDDPTVAYFTALGMDNPLSYVWAALPFSFVIDWLAPVGPWLEAVTAPLGLEFVDGYRTLHTQGALKMKAGPFGIDLTDHRIRDYTGPAEVDLGFLEMERRVYESAPTPKLYFRSPFTLNNPTRMVNAIALLNSMKGH